MRSMRTRKLKEGGLPPGYYTLGDGHIHKVPKSGYSKWYSRGDMKFRFNNEKQEIECYYDGEKVDRMGLSFMDWVENPDYWVDYYYDSMSSAADYYDLASEFGLESKKVQEAIVDYDPREDWLNRLSRRGQIMVNDLLHSRYQVDIVQDLRPEQYAELKKIIKNRLGESKSKKVNESETFVIAYREGGKDKYSSVTANSSADALRIFNASVDKAGRHVNNPHIAVEDVDLSEEINSLPPMKTYKIVRRFDGEDIELATVDARNEDEAKANTIVALLDAGYYEDEVSDEVANGIIRVEIAECNLTEGDTPKQLYEISFLYLYAEEMQEPPYVKSAYYRRDVLVEADSSDEAMDIFNEHYGEMTEYSADGQISDIRISNVYPSLEAYKKKYPYSNKLVLRDKGTNESMCEDRIIDGYTYDKQATDTLKSQDDMIIYDVLKKLPVGTRIIDYEPEIDKHFGRNTDETFDKNYIDKVDNDRWRSVSNGTPNEGSMDTLHLSWFFSDFDYGSIDWLVYVPN